MTETEVLEIVRKTIAETFFVPVEQIGPATVAEDVNGWDSLKHTVLMVRLKNKFDVSLPESVAEATNVADLSKRIHQILAK